MRSSPGSTAHRSSPADPLFAERAGPILDLYAGYWQGEHLHPGDYVVCADEKPLHPGPRPQAPALPAAPGHGQRVEHEYERMGALCYLAAWDARRAKIFDRCALEDGIEPFDALVEQFMSQHPLQGGAARLPGPRQRLRAPRQAQHRSPPGRLAQPDRRARPRPRLMARPRPRSTSPSYSAKVLTPNDFADLDALEAQLLAFGRHYEQIAAPFQWKFTRQDLHKLLAATDTTQPATLAA